MYLRGQHSVERYPKGQHSINRYPLGAHGIARPVSWHVNREVSKRSTPMLAFLLSSAMGLGSLSVPVSALASEGQTKAAAELEAAAQNNGLVLDPDTGLLYDPVTEQYFDPETRELLDAAAVEKAKKDAASAAKSTAPKDTSKSSDSAATETPAQAPSQKTAKDADTPSSSTATDADVDEDAPEEAEEEQVDDGDAVTTLAPSGKVKTQPSTTKSKSSSVSRTIPRVPSKAASVEQSVEPAVSGNYTSVVDDGTTVDVAVTELKVASRLLEAGWTPEMVAAAIGNMYAESGSNPGSFCDMSGMFHYGYEIAGGLFQWTDAGGSAASLSSAGFTGLTRYAKEQNADWTDVTLQTDYFLKTWKDSWAERQTYYDGIDSAYANIDVSLKAFDETGGNDLDGDGIVDIYDEDVDNDGILNHYDTKAECVVNGERKSSKSAAAVKAMPATKTKLSKADADKHVAELTFIFMAGYEGPSAKVAHLDRRIAHAQRVYPAVCALQETRDLNIADSKAGLILASAETMLGGTYIWGAESPESKAFDCSGLTKWCYSLAGVGISHYSEAQFAQAAKVYSIEEAVPGDILWRPGHVGIYIGNGMTVEAKGKNYGIVYGDAKSFMKALHFNALDTPNNDGSRTNNAKKARNTQVQKVAYTMTFVS